MAIITKLKCSSAAAAKRKNEDPSSSPASVTTSADLHLVSLNYIHEGLKMSKDDIDRQQTIELYNLMGRRKGSQSCDLSSGLFLKRQANAFNCVFTRWEIVLMPKRWLVFLILVTNILVLGLFLVGIILEKTKKGLDVVLAPESVVLIVDDTESVWDKHASNLILIEKYNYFATASSKGPASRTNAPSYSESFQGESETDGELALVLSILTRAHQMFFEDHTMGRDVRNILKSIWQNIDVVDDPMD